MSARSPKRLVSATLVRLLSDAEPRKDLAQQIIGREFAGDRSERMLRCAQLLGEQLDRWLLRFDMRVRTFEVIRRVTQREKLTLASKERVFACMLDACDLLDGK